MMDVLQASDVIKFFRAKGSLNPCAGLIYVKGNVVAQLSDACQVSQKTVEAVLESMRKDGLMMFRNDRPAEAEFAFDVWKKRQEPPPAAPVAAPPPAEPESDTKPVETPQAVPQEVKAEQPAHLKHPLFAKAESIASGFLQQGKAVTYTDGSVVIVCKNLFPMARKVLRMTSGEIGTIIRFMYQHGWVRYKYNDPHQPELLYTKWEARYNPPKPPAKPAKPTIDLKTVIQTAAYIADKMEEETERRIKKETTAIHCSDVKDAFACRAYLGKLLIKEAKTERCGNAREGTQCSEAPNEILVGALASEICPCGDELKSDDSSTAVSVSDEAPTSTLPEPLRVPDPPPPADEASDEDMDMALLEDMTVEAPPASLRLPSPTFTPTALPHPMETTVAEVIGYFEAEEAEKDLGEGLSVIVVRRIARAIKALPFLKPLAEHDSVASVVAFEAMRDAMLHDLRDLDGQVSGLLSRKAEQPATDLQPAINALLETDIPAAVERNRPFLVKFRGARRQLVEAVRAVQATIARVDIDAQMVDLQVLDAEFAMSRNRIDPKKVERYAGIIAHLQSSYDEFRTASATYVRQSEEVTKMQGQFPAIRAQTEGVLSKIHVLMQSARMLGEKVAASICPALEDGERQLGIQTAEQEVYGELPFVMVPRSFSNLEKLLDGCAAQLSALRKPRSTIFTVTLSRQEELRRLMIISTAYLIPGPRGNRKGGDFASVAKNILLPAGLITENETRATRDAIFPERDRLYAYTKERNAHRFMPNDTCRKLAAEYLRDCTDPSGLHAQLDNAWTTFFKAWREKKFGGKKTASSD